MEFDLDLSIDLLRRSPATLRALLDGLGEPGARDAAAAARGLGGTRPGAPRSDRTGDGQAVPGRGRSLGALPARADRPPRTPLVSAARASLRNRGTMVACRWNHRPRARRP